MSPIWGVRVRTRYRQTHIHLLSQENHSPLQTTSHVLQILSSMTYGVTDAEILPVQIQGAINTQERPKTSI